MSVKKTIARSFTVETIEDGISVQAQYAPNANPTSSQIHNVWQDGDLFMRTRETDSTTWSAWHRIVGESGDETDFTFNISKSLTSSNATTAPANCYYSSWQDAPVAPTSTYPYLWMKIQKKDGNGNDVGDASYARVTGEKGNGGLTPNQNILLRTIFDRGISNVMEKWTSDWSYTEIDTATDTVIDGRKSIRINASSLSYKLDFSQDVYGKLNVGTWYTLSFAYFATHPFYTFIWDGTNTSGVVDRNAGYYIDGVFNSGDLGLDGHYYWPQEWEGNRHSITFKTKSSFGESHAYILFRASAGTQVALCMPKLEIGTKATPYLANEDDLVGEDGVSYCFVFTKAAARVDENNTVTAELAGYAYKYVGGVRSALVSTTIRYGYILTDSDTYVDTTTNSSGFFDAGTWFNDDDITDYGKNSPSIFAAIVIDGTVVHAEMITISVKGGTGNRGKVGRFFYYAGEWDDFASTDSFLVNDAQAPYFYYNNNYWVFNPETNGTYTKQNMGTPSSSSSNWKLMTSDFKYIITEAIFGAYAHFGSAIINGDWLISGNGTINGALFKNGEEYNGVVAYTLFDPLFPYGIGNANVGINISEISWNYGNGSDIRAITGQYLLKAGRTYVVKILCHVEIFYAGQQNGVYPKLLLWCSKDGVINNDAWIGETDASKYDADQIFQKTINPTSDGLYDIRAGLGTNRTYGYGYVEMVVFECQTNTMFVPQYCVDLLSGETSMAGGKVQANRHGDFIVKGALMYSSLSQDRFILTNTDTTTSPYTYTYNLAKGIYEGKILSPKIPANYININGNLNYNNKSSYMIYLPPARLFEGMEITIILNARASNDWGQLVPLTFRVPTDFNTIDPVLDDGTVTVSLTWNRFAVLYNGGGKILEGGDGGIRGTHLVTSNANVIKLIATKHPLIEYYHASQNSTTQEAYNKKCIAWCVVDVK